MNGQSISDSLLSRFGADLCVTDADEVRFRSSDPWGMDPGVAAAVLYPRDVNDVSAMVRFCTQNNIVLVPQGGNTGLASGATPDSSGEQVIINLSRLNKIRELDAENYTITAEAGCVLATVQAAAEAQGRLFPPSFGAEGSCQIGGILSTNAGGHNVLRYGNTRDMVLGLEAVLADGTIWHGLRKLRKNNTGYDIKQLFIGAEGTLGVITAAVLKLFPKVHSTKTLIATLPSLDIAPRLLSQAREASADALSAFEIIPRRLIELHREHVGPVNCVPQAGGDWFALLEFTGAGDEDALDRAVGTFLEDVFTAGLISDATIAASLAQREEMWHLRDGVAEAQLKNGLVIYFDISVAVSQTPAFIHKTSAALRAFDPNVDINAFGHAGDGNIHFNVLQPKACSAEEFHARKAGYEKIIYDAVAEFDGSFSAEHGIGRAKIAQMRRAKPAVELHLMQVIRSAISSRTLNPGKLVPLD